MYIKIDLTDYTRLRNLSYAPQTDITGTSVPINEFSVDIITDEAIATGQYAELYDDLDNLWARYWITYAERESADAVHVLARSDIALMDGVTLPAVMYGTSAVDAVTVDDILDDIMVRQAGGGMTAAIDYALDSSFSGMLIYGYCPEQSARERLQWVCFVLGAYVKSFFNDRIEILPIDATAALVPLDMTFRTPKVTYKDYVTAVQVTAYSFTQGTPQTTDKWVSDGTNTYIVTEQAVTLANNDAPASAADNVVKIDGVYLINSGNASAILSHLAPLYFKRAEVDLDVIDNAAYIPGDVLTVYADAQTMFGGYATSCAFAVGVQARASVKLMACESVEGAPLVILYQYGDVNLGRAEYVFPVGYSYTIQNLYLDWTMDGHRYVFRPTTATVTGTMVAGGKNETVSYEVALDLEIATGILEIVSVDEVTVETDAGTGIATGVIA